MPVTRRKRRRASAGDQWKADFVAAKERVAEEEGNPSLPGGNAGEPIKPKEYQNENAQGDEQRETTIDPADQMEKDEKRFENPEEELSWPTEIEAPEVFEDQAESYKANQRKAGDEYGTDDATQPAEAKAGDETMPDRIEDADARREAIMRQLGLKASRAGKIATRLVSKKILKEEHLLLVARMLETADAEALRQVLVAIDANDVAMGITPESKKQLEDASKRLDKLDELGSAEAAKDEDGKPKAAQPEAPAEDGKLKAAEPEDEGGEAEDEGPDEMVEDVISEAVPEVVEDAVGIVVDEAKDAIVEDVVDQLAEDFLETTDREEDEIDFSDDMEVDDFDLDAETAAVFDDVGTEKQAEAAPVGKPVAASKKGPKSLGGSMRVEAQPDDGLFAEMRTPKIKL